MPITGDGGHGSAAFGYLGWERLLLASALLGGFLAILAVSGAALLLRLAEEPVGNASPCAAAGAVAVSLALVPLARTGRGPVGAIARRLPPRLDGGLRRRPVAGGLAGLLTLVAVQGKVIITPPQAV
ncbi:MAG: hypothetical protein AB1486_33530 [Planctomycetota bacterium]